MKKTLVSILALSISSISFAATMNSMDNSQIKKTLNGNTMTTVPMVTMNDELMNSNPATVFFDTKGEVKGQFASKPANDPQTDQGKWEVKAKDTLCVTWDHWHQAKPICVNVYNLGNSILFVNKDTKKFETMALKADIKSGNNLS